MFTGEGDLHSLPEPKVSIVATIAYDGLDKPSKRSLIDNNYNDYIPHSLIMHSFCTSFTKRF